MAQERDQYVQFTIKLLKGSFALNALWQDALNYHMIDQPEKLIALRLTEYYELISRGVRPGLSSQGVPATPNSSGGNSHVSPVFPSADPGIPPVQPPEEHHIETGGRTIVVSSSSPAAEQNAEDAADYWAPL